MKTPYGTMGSILVVVCADCGLEVVTSPVTITSEGLVPPRWPELLIDAYLVIDPIGKHYQETGHTEFTRQDRLVVVCEDTTE
jgi:hypothetical protein